MAKYRPKSVQDIAERTDRKYGTSYAIVGRALSELRRLGATEEDNRAFIVEVSRANTAEETTAVCEKWIDKIKKGEGSKPASKPATLETVYHTAHYHVLRKSNSQWDVIHAWTREVKKTF